jgi:hypothetical protein
MLVVLAGAAVIAWTVAAGQDGDRSPTAHDRALPLKWELVSPDGLQGLAAAAGHPIYWAGALPGRKLQMTLTGDGSVFIRYLPRAVAAADRTPKYLSIGSAPGPQAWAATKSLARVSGAIVRRLPHGGIAVTQRNRPQTVAFAYPGSAVQGQIFDVVPLRALRLVAQGSVRPVLPSQAQGKARR